jgi:mannose-6-phosphate isomerase-like protein (cupin superfamily)
MLGWVGDIERATLDNTDFRRVLFTGERAQLTVMRLRPGEEIGVEAHDHLDQFIRVEAGRARVTFGRAADHVDEEHEVRDDWAVIVPAGVWHNVVNVGDGDLKLYSLYAPPEHPADTVQRTKAEADEAEAAEHGR